MTRGNYSEHLRAILCYDSMVQVLDIADRYWLHREIILNHGYSTDPATVNDTQGYILGISQYIVNHKWKRPELKYNSARELEVYDEAKELWKPFKPEDYV
ncbi:hypothetical protein [Yeosuana marina]|uniref:hypothetical protein n=1 Tax=Yeosuana marina TaxID=1565536 RepID=UPI00141FE2EF|nr:hypothetical protein [Yeosuana marina]